MTTVDTLADRHFCPACGPDRSLTVQYDREGKEWRPFCPTCRTFEGFRQRVGIVEQWKRDPESVPAAVANRLEEKYGRGEKPLTTQALANIDEPTMLERIEKARWTSEVAKVDRPILAALAVQYGLDPIMGELIIYENKPYVTFNGWLRKIQEHPQFAGIEDRPMTKEERDAYGFTAPTCWIAKIHRHDWKVPAVGTGTADAANPYRNNPVERKFPQAFARKRAIIQAGKVGFLHALPFAKMPSAEEAGITVDTRTGEIIAGEGHVVDDLPVQAEDATFTEAPADLFPDPEAPEPDPTAPTSDWLAAEQAVKDACAQVGRDFGKIQEWAGDPKHYNVAWQDMTAAQLKDLAGKVEKSGLQTKGA